MTADEQLAHPHYRTLDVLIGQNLRADFGTYAVAGWMFLPVFESALEADPVNADLLRRCCAFLEVALAGEKLVAEAVRMMVADATTANDPDMTAQRNMVISLAQDLGWPVPAVYADVGQADQPGSQLAALAEAITAGRHDGELATHPAQIEAFDRLCRQHGARLRRKRCNGRCPVRSRQRGGCV